MIVLGIDLGIHKIAVAELELDQVLNVAQHALPGSTGDQTMSRARELHELGSWIYDYALGAQADQIFIEQIIIGNNRKYSLQLAQTLGSVLSALYVVSLTTGARVHLVDNTVWKKRMLGNGNADKEAIRSYIDTTHPAYALLCDGDQDRYDACCVGLYGLDVLAHADGLRLQSGCIPGSDGPAAP